jgi:hypothetical protein
MARDHRILANVPFDAQSNGCQTSSHDHFATSGLIVYILRPIQVSIYCCQAEMVLAGGTYAGTETTELDSVCSVVYRIITKTGRYCVRGLQAKTCLMPFEILLPV